MTTVTRLALGTWRTDGTGTIALAWWIIPRTPPTHGPNRHLGSNRWRPACTERTLS